jgi:transcriptional regulator with XRE-family HTH domain
MRDLYQVIGGKVRDARIKRELSQADLARRLSLSRSSVTNIENGLQKISVLDIFKVADILDVDIAELLPTRLELAQSPTPPIEKIDRDPRFSSSEKKELKKVINLL